MPIEPINPWNEKLCDSLSQRPSRLGTSSVTSIFLSQPPERSPACCHILVFERFQRFNESLLTVNLTLCRWWIIYLAMLALGVVAQAQSPVEITVQPVQPTLPLALGTQINLSVTAKGSPPLSYQWQRNGVSIRGATESRFSLDRLTAFEGGTFSVLVGNPLGAVRSRSVVIYPNLTRLPFNDLLDPRQIGDRDYPNRIRGLSGNGLGDNLKATVQRRDGEPLHADAYGGASVWVVWRPEANGIAKLSTKGTAFDTLLAVYIQKDPKQPVGYNNLLPVASDDDSEPYRTSQIQFTATSGVDYFIAVDGDGSASRTDFVRAAVQRGNIVFSWDLEVTNQRMPFFTNFPKDFSLTLGTQLRLTAQLDSTGADSRSWQWFFKGAPLAGAVESFFSLPKINREDVGRYYCRADSKFGLTTRSVFSKVVDVQIFRRSNNSDAHVLAQDKFSTAADYTFPPPSKLASPFGRAAKASPSSVQPLGVALGTSGTQIFSTIGTGKDEGEPDHCGEAGGASEWYAFMADSDGAIIADTSGSDFDTVLAAYYDNGTGSGIFDGLVNVGCNNNHPDFGNQSRIAFHCLAGRVYYLAVDGVGGASGLAQLNYSLVNLLTILQAPINITTNLGRTATFQVSALGVGSLHYQWRMNGIDMPGKIFESLTLTNLQATDSGSYSVEVKDDLDTRVSQPATLSINLPPSITVPPSPATVLQGTATNFVVSASGTAPLAFQWLRNGGPLPGKVNPLLVLSGIQADDAGNYSVVITNIAGAITSAPVALTVHTPPVITSQPQPLTVNQGAAALFSVAANSSLPLSFQWRKGNTDLPGKTQAQLALANVQASDEASYSVVVRNDAGSVTSSIVSLSINLPPSITVPPSPATVLQGTATNFVVGASGTAPLAFQWLRNGGPLPGKVNPLLVLSGIQADDAGNYSVVISNIAGGITSAPVALTVHTPPVITTQPQPLTVNQGAAALFSVAANSSLPLSFQWFLGTDPIIGANQSSYRIESVLPEAQGLYWVVLSNAAGTVASRVAQLTVQLAPQPSISANRNQNGSLQILVIGGVGGTYVLEQSTDSKTWTPIRTNIHSGFEHNVVPSSPTDLKFFRSLRR